MGAWLSALLAKWLAAWIGGPPPPASSSKLPCTQGVALPVWNSPGPWPIGVCDPMSLCSSSFSLNPSTRGQNPTPLARRRRLPAPSMLTFRSLAAPRTDFYRFWGAPRAIKKSSILRPLKKRPQELKISTLGRQRLHFLWIFNDC